MNLELRAQIKSKYIQSLVIPKEKLGSFLICPVGFIGSGKTTVMKYLCEQLSCIRFSNDELRLLLLKHQQDYSELKSISFEIIDEYLKQGYAIGIDGNCGTKQTKEYIDTYSAKYAIPVFWIKIALPEETNLKYIRGRVGALLTNDNEVMVQNYYAQKEEAQRNPVEIDFFATIDTSSPNMAVQLEEISQSIQNTLKKV